jgi:hypothetical protein
VGVEAYDHCWKTVPALSSSPISSALEQLRDLPVGDRALPAGVCPSLTECLQGAPDSRDPRGVRHTLTSLLLATVAAMLAGAQPLAAVGEWVADAPPQVLAAHPDGQLSPRRLKLIEYHAPLAPMLCIRITNTRRTSLLGILKF